MVKNRKPITIPEIRINAGIERQYSKALVSIVRQMRDDIQQTLVKEFKQEAKQEKIAMDSITEWAAHVIDYLLYRWEKRLASLSYEIAEDFVNRTVSNYDTLMKNHMRKAGFTVRFQITQFQKDSISAVIENNVSLIKSISSQYLERVQGDVWRCVTTGYNLAELSKNLEQGYGITRRRAERIARDQANKAHSAIELARRKELGIKKAIWLHSHAGKTPRHSHQLANNKEFDVNKGMYLDGEWIYPGQLPNCRCASKSVIEGIG